jgi:DNA-binding Lrp family transcriptional regulator
VVREAREVTMKAAFVLVKCELGRLEEVANALMEIEGVSEVHSITGGFDLLVKMYAPSYEAFGDLVPDRLQKVPGIRDTTTLLAFRAFKPTA